MTRVNLLLTCLATAGCVNVLAMNKKCEAFSISDVKVTSPTILHVQMLAKDYILGIDADRLLAPYYKEAGLAKVAENYTNWENTGLDGHIGGHYLSALSYMYAATGDERLKERLDYMVAHLAMAQGKDGYLCGVPEGKAMWTDVFAGRIDAGAFSLNGKWVPLYNIHKIMAGLRDAYLIGGSADAKLMFIKLCSWFEANASRLSDDQIQAMLVSEHGGVNEIMADAYDITGEYRFLQMARRLTHKSVLVPLGNNEDRLTGMHANTQIPKIIGMERVAQLSNDADWRAAADFFWRTVTCNRSVSIGGNSVREHFHPADDFSSMIDSEQGPETCNTYNMLRLTKMLFLDNPDASYADFYERAMLNHILSTVNDVQGGFVYFTPMRPGHYRVYSQPQTSFWCCVGSGMENHSRYGEMIFAHAGNDALFVNTFLPSKLDWKANKTSVEILGDFPWGDSSQIVVHSKKGKKWTMRIRKPEWADQFSASINGVTYSKPEDDGYIAICREWGRADTLSVSMPMTLKSRQLPDGSDYFSFSYGPLVLAADLGTDNQDGLYADDSRGGHIASGPKMDLSDVPMFVTDGDPISHFSKIGDEWRWTSDCVRPDKFASVGIVPFINLSGHRYQVYFRVIGTTDYATNVERLRLLELARKELDEQTVDAVTCGEQQPESDHSFAHGSSVSGVNDGRHWRKTQSWFSYDLKAAAAHQLSVSYLQAPDRSAVVVCGGQSFELKSGEERIRTAVFPITASDANAVTVKVVANVQSHFSPCIFEIRVLR